MITPRLVRRQQTPRDALCGAASLAIRVLFQGAYLLFTRLPTGLRFQKMFHRIMLSPLLEPPVDHCTKIYSLYVVNNKNSRKIHNI